MAMGLYSRRPGWIGADKNGTAQGLSGNTWFPIYGANVIYAPSYPRPEPAASRHGRGACSRCSLVALAGCASRQSTADLAGGSPAALPSRLRQEAFP